MSLKGAAAAAALKTLLTILSSAIVVALRHCADTVAGHFLHTSRPCKIVGSYVMPDALLFKDSRDVFCRPPRCIGGRSCSQECHQGQGGGGHRPSAGKKQMIPEADEQRGK